MTEKLYRLSNVKECLLMKHCSIELETPLEAKEYLSLIYNTSIMLNASLGYRNNS